MNVQKQNPILSLAPFQGITDMTYRNLYLKHFQGIDYLYTPFFASINTDNSKNLMNDEVSPKANNTRIIIPQILSNHADEIVRFANQCGDMGYTEVNLNLGCPFPRVANKKRGSGMLAYPEMVNEILNHVYSSISINMSIKCRIGFFSNAEFEPLIKVFNQYPISNLIVHPRIGKQQYKGEADKEFFAGLIGRINAPLTYNGDIFTREDFENADSIFANLNSYMLGRGVLTNPFLPEEIRGITNSKSRQERLHDFMSDIYHARLGQTGGSPKVIGRMKELWSYSMNLFDDPQNVWRKLKKTTRFEEYEDAVNFIFNNYKVL